MSNIYIQEPSTEGKVLLTTSFGEIDIELWSKEAPRACRNFVQLCMEGYYNGTIFHRVIKGFSAQGGDPTGTGTGGESIYGKTFKDEFHSRLRFVRRGLVAMANGGQHDNASQFFFTLGSTPELQNKHTIFGKVTGQTLYNLPRLEEGLIGKDDRPEYPHKIIRAEILSNPYTDIYPRVKIENEIPKGERRKKKKGAKNFKLLSFGDEAEEEEEEVIAATKNFSTKGNSAHDIADDPTLSASTGGNKNASPDTLERIRQKLQKEEQTEAIKNEVEEAAKETEIESPLEVIEKEKEQKMSEMKAEIKQLKREITGKSIKGSEKENIVEENVNDEADKSDAVKEYEKERSKFVDEKKVLPRPGASKREDQTLALLQRFTDKVHKAFEEASDDEEQVEEEDDNDDGWLKHRIQFDSSAPILAKDASVKDDHWHDINDPRNAMNKRRRDDLSEPRKNKK